MSSSSAIVASQSPESDKFVIQDSELKNQQTYLSQANRSHASEVNDKTPKNQTEAEEDDGTDMNFDPESDTML